MNLKDVQTELTRLDLYHRGIDGDYGPRTDDAIEALFLKEHVSGFDRWSDARRTVAAEQLLAKLRGIEVGTIDGLVGPQTRHALEIWDARKANNWQPVPAVENWRDQRDADITAGKIIVPPPSRPLPPLAAAQPHPAWPRQSRVPEFYGAIGTRQISLTLPFAMLIAWETDKAISKWSCHEKCAENFERIWVRSLDHYGLSQIRMLGLDLWGGTLNVRKMRGSNAWSMHSWGIAEDVDPDRNQLKWHRAQAVLDNPEYDAFWGFVYAEGAIGLGRERDYDWMHFQFALL